MTDKEFLNWLSDRLIHVYGESPSVDFVHRLNKIAKREWVGLTDEEANKLWESTDSDWELMKRVEAKLKEKNAKIEAAHGIGKEKA